MGNRLKLGRKHLDWQDYYLAHLFLEGYHRHAYDVRGDPLKVTNVLFSTELSQLRRCRENSIPKYPPKDPTLQFLES